MYEITIFLFLLTSIGTHGLSCTTHSKFPQISQFALIPNISDTVVTLRERPQLNRVLWMRLVSQLRANTLPEMQVQS